MDRAAEVVPGIEPALLGRVVERLLELEPTTIAILLSGSYAKGTADDQSDLDVQVVTAERPASPYRMWFEQRLDSKPLHDIARYLADGTLERHLGFLDSQ